MRRLYYPLMKMVFRFATATTGRREYLHDEIQRLGNHDTVADPDSLKNMLDGLIARRKSALSKYVDLRNKRGLEVGPLHAPTVSKSESDISYMDYKTREEQIQRCNETKVYFPYIPETDILCPDGDFTKVLTKKYDYVIANHVIEHIPDFIGWFKKWETFINDDGVFFLEIPDKRYTFDKDRRETTVFHILADYYHQSTNVNFEEFLEKEFHFGSGPDMFSKFTDLIQAFECKGYVDMHYHVFNHETFMKNIFQPILDTGLLSYSVLEYSHVKDHIGFYLILKKVTS